MSLVEQALKKAQQSRAATSAAPVRPQHATSIGPGLQAQASVVSAQPQRNTARPAPRVLHIDRDALRARRLLPPAAQEQQITNQLRHIKRPLVAKALGRGGERIPDGQLIMIASALPGEGKTFTSINLALSLALEKDTSILLVDADVAKPHLSSLFGAEQDCGLLDVLRDESLDIESVIMSTDVPGLFIMPAGTQSSTAAELLASARMQQVAHQLLASEPRRIVIFDSPPVLLTSEARVLAELVGQIAVVVRAGETAQHAVLDALDLLPENKSVGLILNQSDESAGTDYYGYYGQRGEEHGSAS